ncbi:hypothetical protein [Borrelia sp. P9F1]|uniref:hypothetical protein n=1 Tax=Borrelia sp. P9F1 TaxID=3058374 RepID=UPI00264A2B76|nr:hypothetical protein [Borrelia sp. P9F1]WKC58540.1 hypothetical protein QYZ68_04905 [Borrelia sp. P9F1]WKC58629.1 hypothetical protein QYZ68_05355 [Borrelia sp. P9F1]
MIRMIIFLLFILVLSCNQSGLSEEGESPDAETPVASKSSESEESPDAETPVASKSSEGAITNDYKDVSNTPNIKPQLDLMDKRVNELSQKIIQDVKAAKNTGITTQEKVKTANKLRKTVHELAVSLDIIAKLKEVDKAPSVTKIDATIKTTLDNTKNDLPESTNDSSSIDSRIEALRTFYNTLLIEKYNLVQSMSAYIPNK